MDTIQMVQSLRNCLPASHIPVNSWKSEDRQFRSESGAYDGCWAGVDAGAENARIPRSEMERTLTVYPLERPSQPKFLI